MTNEITQGQRREMALQIGTMNLMAISGGRVTPISDGIELPVGSGYSVRVQLDQGWDTYIVSRVFRRGTKEWIKGRKENIYADEVGEQAYRASSFRSYDESEW